MRHNRMRTRCWAMKPMETLEGTAFGSIFFDVQVCDTDAKSYGNCRSKKVLERAARRKKDNHEAASLKSLKRHQDFTPMIYSVNGMANKHVRSCLS